MKKITFLITFLLAFGMNCHAQVSAYGFSDMVGTYTETSGAATLLPNVRADSFLSTTQEIGFTFNYDNVDYTQFKMSSNGFISLNVAGTSNLTTNNLSTANGTSRPIIAPLWDDLDGATPTTSVAAYEVTGTAPNRVLTVEWRNWEWNWNSGATPVISFQVKLYETTNVIEFVYREEAGAVTNGSATIGIGAATGSGAGSYLNLTSVATPAVSSSSSMTTINTKPITGQIYTFSPPTPCTGTPGAGTVTPASQELADNQTPQTLVASGYTTGETGLTFQWEESSDDVTYVDAVGGTGATTASYTPPAFSGTIIYYRLKVTCTNSSLSDTTDSVVLNPCPVFTVPSLEDFTTYVPQCWLEADNGDLVAGPLTYGSSSWSADGFGNNGTTGSFDYNLFTTGANDWILSPLYAIPATGYELKFDAAAVQYGTTNALTTPWEEDDYVEVLVSTGTTNWIVLYTYTSANVPSNTGTSNIIDLDAYSGQDVRFAFRAVEGAANGGADLEFSVDNFEIRLTPSCVEPTVLTATNITSNSADLGWTENGTSTVWDIEWGTAGFTPTGTPTVNDTTDNPYILSSLTPQTDYEFYVRSDCGSDNTDVSVWVGPFAFRTLCAAIVAPYTENFETFTVSSSAFSEQNCWTATNIGGYLWEVAATTDTSSAGTGPGTGVSDGNYLFTEATSGAAGDAIDLTSPLIDLSGLVAPSLTFDYHMFGDDMGTLDVIVNSGGTETTVFTLSGQQQTSETDPFLTQIIDLAAYAGETIQVTFRGTKGADFESDMAIDTVIFDELPACLAPTVLTATNISSNSAELGWTENGTATVWDIEWGTAGFTPTGTPTVNDTGDNPYALGGLSSSTDYEFYVRSDCGSDNTDVSVWVGPFAFTTECAVFTAPYTEDFENAGTTPDCWTNDGAEPWLFGTTGGDHVGNGGTITGSTASGNYYAYVDASGTQANAVLTSPFVDVSGLTTPALSFYEISDAEDSDNSQLVVEVWDGVAWNNVGTYNTNTLGWELKIIDLSGLTITGPVQARFTFTEPTPGDFDDDIAIDDVSFDELPSCLVPNMLTANNITSNSADLGWTAGGTETLWDIELVDITAGGTATGTPTTTGVSNPYMQTGLTAANDYEFYVRADCTGGDFSSWTGPFSFTTLCSPETVFPSTTDFTNNPPTSCWSEAGSGEVADGPSGLGASDWKAGRAYTDASAVVINSNVINLWQSVDREWLISPVYDIPVGIPHSLVVNVAVTNYQFSGTSDETDTDTMGSDDEVQLLQSIDGGTTWTNITTWNVGNQPAVTGTEFIADLTAVSGTIQFALWASDGTVDNTEDYDFHIGEFTVIDNATLSIEENEVFLGFKYFPNPVKGTLSLRSQNDIQNVAVYNMLGQEVLRTSPNSLNSEVNMASLQTGAYFVKVTINDAVETIRVIKQ